MPSERIREIDKLHVPKVASGHGFANDAVYISVVRDKCLTEVWKETEGESGELRKAKFLDRYLSNVIPIIIRDHELIVGHHHGDPLVIPFAIEEMDYGVTDRFIMEGRIKEEEKDDWEEAIEYWRHRNIQSVAETMLTKEEIDLAKTRQRYMEVLPSQTLSRTMPDHDLYLELGLKGVCTLIDKKLEEIEETKYQRTGPETKEIMKQINSLKAMKLSAEAVIKWANRYSQQAKKMSEVQKDPQRKEELLEISRICAKVPANPPESFHEALQSHWFVFLVYHVIEYLCHGTSARLDQLFWPYYEKDVIKDKIISREYALELMQNLLINVDDLGRPLGLQKRRYIQGNNLLATYTIGGTTIDGEDACNDLTLIILDAIDDLRMYHPDFKFRWHPKVNPQVWNRVNEVIQSGLGQPSIKNEQVAIDYLMEHYGYSMDEARSWAVVGCISPAPTINYGRCRRDAWSLYPAKYLEMTLFNGVDPATSIEKWDPYTETKQIGLKTGDPLSFKTFEDFFEAYRKQIRWWLQKSMHIKNVSEIANNIMKRPFTSALCKRSLNSGRDIMDAPDKGMPFINIPSMVDAVDSIISLNKLVYDDKKYTMEELVGALKVNWEGYEVMRADFINAPKFGNDDDYADEIAKKVYDLWAEEASKVHDLTGNSPMVQGLVISYMFHLAPIIGALPDGRKQGDWLTDGGINPHAGYDRSGPMSAVLSASKIDARRQKANIFNQKFSATSLSGPAGLEKLKHYNEAAMKLGLDMIQHNVVDVETLIAAQKNPEAYKDLTVRISGYSARFIDLDPWVQNTVIQRTEHAL